MFKIQKLSWLSIGLFLTSTALLASNGKGWDGPKFKTENFSAAHLTTLTQARKNIKTCLVGTRKNPGALIETMRSIAHLIKAKVVYYKKLKIQSTIDFARLNDFTYDHLKDISKIYRGLQLLHSSIFHPSIQKTKNKILDSYNIATTVINGSQFLQLTIRQYNNSSNSNKSLYLALPLSGKMHLVSIPEVIYKSTKHFALDPFGYLNSQKTIIQDISIQIPKGTRNVSKAYFYRVFYKRNGKPLFLKTKVYFPWSRYMNCLVNQFAKN